MADELVRTFHRSVGQGSGRLHRSWPGVLATGAVGGLDVSMGIVATLVVEHETHDPLLGALAFSIGFIALTLAGSELFTESFLVPVAAAAAEKAPWWALPRLWAGTLAANLVGGWVAMGLAMAALPGLRSTAVVVAGRAADAGIGRASFASAVLGGLAITLMTWMERSTDSVPARLVAASSIAFLLAAAPLLHAVVTSLELFAALHAGAPFGYARWLAILGWSALGNMAGGLVLVTGLRLVQVGTDEIHREQDRRPRDDSGEEEGADAAMAGGGDQDRQATGAGTPARR